MFWINVSWCVCVAYQSEGVLFPVVWRPERPPGAAHCFGRHPDPHSVPFTGLRPGARQSGTSSTEVCPPSRSWRCGRRYMRSVPTVSFLLFSLRRESEHDQVMRSIYEEMESQIREEREKWLTQVQSSTFCPCNQNDHLQISSLIHLLWNQGTRQKKAERATWRGAEVPRARVGDDADQTERGGCPNSVVSKELKFNVLLSGPVVFFSKLESRIQQLVCEQANTKGQNQQLRSLNIQLQEQVERSKEDLQTALGQLSLLELNAAQEQVARQRWAANSTSIVKPLPVLEACCV